jgi:hypothetical protein
LSRSADEFKILAKSPYSSMFYIQATTARERAGFVQSGCIMVGSVLPLNVLGGAYRFRIPLNVGNIKKEVIRLPDSIKISLVLEVPLAQIEFIALEAARQIHNIM